MSKQNEIEFDARLWNVWLYGQREPLLKEHGAKKLSLMKWHPDNPNRGEGACALCCVFLSIGILFKSCGNCPLYPKTCTFYEQYNPRAIYWLFSQGPHADEEKYADQMFEAILKIPDDRPK